MTREELLAITQAIKEGFQSSGGRATSTRSVTGEAGGSTRTLLTKEEYERELKLIKEVYDGEEELSELRRLITTQLDDQKNQIEDLLKAEIRRGNTSGELYERYKKDLKQVNDLIKQTKKDLEAVAASDALPTLEDGFVKLTKASLNFFASVTKPVQLSGMIDYAKKIDSLGASFAKTTGAGRKYLFEARQLNQDLQKFGATTEDAMKSFTDLSMGLTNFTNESIAAQTEIAKTATILDKLGQPAAATAKNVSTLKAVLGESNESALELQQTLGNAAFTLGMSVNEINEKFISNLNRLSIYGSGAKDQFVRLQTFAKATNLEVSTLTDLTERLSTFEGSAEFAGRLNAITGKDLFDVTQLTMLEGQDKIDYIVERIQGAGFDLDDPKMMRVIQQASGMDANTFRSMINASGAKIADVSAKVGEKMVEGSAGLAKNAEMSSTFIQKTEAYVEALQSREATATKALEAYAIASEAQLKVIGGISGTGAAGLGIAGMLAGLLAGGLGGYLTTKIAGYFAKRRLEKNLGVDSETGKPISPEGTTAKDALDMLSGKGKKGCIAICEDSLRKLANMIGAGESEGFDFEFGKRKKKTGKKASRKTQMAKKGLTPAARKAAAAIEDPLITASKSRQARAAAMKASKVSGDVTENILEASGKTGFFGRMLGSARNLVGKASGALGKIGLLDKIGQVSGFFKSLPIGKILGALGVLIEPIMGAFQIKDMLAGADPKDPSLRKEIGKKILATGGNTILSGLALIPPLTPVAGPLSLINGLAGMAGYSAGDLLAKLFPDSWLEGIGGLVADAFGNKIDPELMGTGPTQPNMAGDMYSDGDRFYVGPEGTYQFSEKDFFTAGTRDSYGNIGGSSKEEMALLKEQNALLMLILKQKITFPVWKRKSAAIFQQ